MIPTNESNSPLRIPGLLLIRVVLCLVLLLTSVNVQFAAAAPPAQGGDPEAKIESLLQALGHLEEALAVLRELGRQYPGHG